MSLTVGTGSGLRNWLLPPMPRSIVSEITAPPCGPASGSSIPGSATTPSCRTATQSDRLLALSTVALVLVMSIDNPPSLGMGIPAELWAGRPRTSARSRPSGRPSSGSGWGGELRQKKRRQSAVSSSPLTFVRPLNVSPARGDLALLQPHPGTLPTPPWGAYNP